MWDTAGEARMNSCDVLLWTPAHRPMRTFIQQFCMDTECSLEDMLEGMDDRDE